MMSGSRNYMNTLMKVAATNDVQGNSSSSLVQQLPLMLLVVVWMMAFVGNNPASGCTSSDSSQYNGHQIVRKTKENELMVAVDEDAKLHCMTNSAWKKCVWKPPRNGVRELRCEFTKGADNKITCPSFPEIHYDVEASEAEEHNCAIIVQNIQEHHEGNWRCEFTLDLPEEDYQEPVVIKDRIWLMARGYRYP